MAVRLKAAAAAVLMAPLLGACGMAVVSEQPLVGEAERAAAPPLRDGLWAVVDEGCTAPTSAAVAAWGDCAEPMIVKDGEVLEAAPKPAGDGGEGSWEVEVRLGSQIIGGQPALLQQELTAPGGQRLFLYVGLDQTRTDAQGRIIAARATNSICADPDAEPTEQGDVPAAPGFTAVEGACPVTTLAEVRRGVAIGQRSGEWSHFMVWVADAPPSPRAAG